MPFTGRLVRRALRDTLALGLGVGLIAGAAWAGEAAPTIAAPPAEAAGLAPFPAPKTIRQTAVIQGRPVAYDLTVGAVALKDATGRITGEVVYTAYTLPGRAAETRPVTFALNGGPGAASAYLNLGAIGPKRLNFGREGVYASDPPTLSDNPNSWLDFTDLVFIDPIGTGYSRSRLGPEETKAAFLKPDPDIRYIAAVIDDWLRLNGRTTSPKHLIGESYGGYRVPRLAQYMQTDLGVGVSGITLVSPALDLSMSAGKSALSPLPWMSYLPSMAAAAKERRGETVTEETQGPVELYARTEFVQDFLAGQRDKAATDRMAARVARELSLDPALVRQLAGRVPLDLFVRGLRRDQGLIGSYYEVSQTAFDPFPERQTSDYNDPNLGATASFAEAMIDIVNRQVGWKVEGRYFINNFGLGGQFDRSELDGDQAVTDLRKALANDPKMSVLIAHGYTDLACPYFLSKLLVRQMPEFGAADRVKVDVYPGGHMFYARPDSAAAFRHDALRAYRVPGA